jgi:hypothetical protein
MSKLDEKKSYELHRPRDPTQKKDCGLVTQLNSAVDLEIMRLRSLVSARDIEDFDKTHHRILAICIWSGCDDVESVKKTMTFFLLRPYTLRLNNTLASVILATSEDLEKAVSDDPQQLTQKSVQSKFFRNLFGLVVRMLIPRMKKDRTLEIPDDR